MDIFIIIIGALLMTGLVAVIWYLIAKSNQRKNQRNLAQQSRTNLGSTPHSSTRRRSTVSLETLESIPRFGYLKSLVGGDSEVARRLVDSVKQDHPALNLRQCCDRAIDDLIEDRR